MLFKIISYFPSILGLSAIGLLTFLKNSKSKVNLLFFLLVSIIALWLFVLFIGDLTINRTVSLWALRMAAAIGTLMVPLVLYFSAYFPVEIQRRRCFFHLLAIGPALIFVILAFTPKLIPSVELQPRSAQPA